MLIMNQERDGLYNLSQMTDVFIFDNRSIKIGDMISGSYKVIGKYDSKERAMEVLEEIGSEYCLLTNEEKGYVANGMYYMPKE